VHQVGFHYTDIGLVFVNGDMRFFVVGNEVFSSGLLSPVLWAAELFGRFATMP
jgi:hypothetical protein